MTFDQALKCIELEMKITDYSIKDDQLYGFGELLKEVIIALNDIGSKEQI